MDASLIARKLVLTTDGFVKTEQTVQHGDLTYSFNVDLGCVLVCPGDGTVYKRTFWFFKKRRIFYLRGVLERSDYKLKQFQT